MMNNTCHESSAPSRIQQFPDLCLVRSALSGCQLTAPGLATHRPIRRGAAVRQSPTYPNLRPIECRGDAVGGDLFRPAGHSRGEKTKRQKAYDEPFSLSWGGDTHTKTDRLLSTSQSETSIRPAVQPFLSSLSSISATPVQLH